ncbi:hypothetical protein C8F01DRAFT_1146108, partial [Mycena amicta]
VEMSVTRRYAILYLALSPLISCRVWWSGMQDAHASLSPFLRFRAISAYRKKSRRSFCACIPESPANTHGHPRRINEDTDGLSARWQGDEGGDETRRSRMGEA